MIRNYKQTYFQYEGINHSNLILLLQLLRTKLEQTNECKPNKKNVPLKII